MASKQQKRGKWQAQIFPETSVGSQRCRHPDRERQRSVLLSHLAGVCRGSPGKLIGLVVS